MSTETKEQRIERIVERFRADPELQALVRKDLTALCEEMEREKWQSIESAPMDGTEVLLLVEWDGKVRRMIGYWGTIDWPRQSGIVVPKSEMWRESLDNYGVGTPLSWQPLPQPPAT